MPEHCGPRPDRPDRPQPCRMEQVQRVATLVDRLRPFHVHDARDPACCHRRLDVRHGPAQREILRRRAFQR